MFIVAKRLDGSKWHLVRGRPRPGHIVLHGNPAPHPKHGQAAPQFSAHVCCGQTAGWINMPFGMEVDLGPGHTVSDGTQLPPLPGKGHSSPLFSAHVYCGQMVAHISYCWARLYEWPQPLCVLWKQFWKLTSSNLFIILKTSIKSPHSCLL